MLFYLLEFDNDHLNTTRVTLTRPGVEKVLDPRNLDT